MSESKKCFLYLKKFFIIITEQSTLFSPKTQEFVRAVLIAFVNKNLFLEFLKKKIDILADGTVVKERLKTPENNNLLLFTINNLMKETN